MDVGKEWISSEHQTTGKHVTSDPLEKSIEEHRSAFVRGPGDNEGTGGLPEETRSCSVPQATQLGYPTKINKLELGSQLK